MKLSGSAQDKIGRRWKGAKYVPEIYTHTHTLYQVVHLPESSFRGMMIHVRDSKMHRLQMECAPSKGAMNLSHKAAASTVPCNVT